MYGKKILDSNELGVLKKGTEEHSLSKDFDFPNEDDTALEFVKRVDDILSNLKTD